MLSGEKNLIPIDLLRPDKTQARLHPLTVANWQEGPHGGAREWVQGWGYGGTGMLVTSHPGCVKENMETRRMRREDV